MKKAEAKKNYENDVTVIIPLGIPGMGKSTIHEELFSKHFNKSSHEVKYTMISNDEIRKNLVKEHQKQNPNKSIDEVFQSTRHLLQDHFLQSLGDAIINKKHKQQVIFLDKNHPPPILRKVVEYLNEIQKNESKIKITKVALIP